MEKTNEKETLLREKAKREKTNYKQLSTIKIHTIMKKYFIYAVSALALAGCSSDDFLGGQPSPTKLTDNNVINFNGGSSATTRVTQTGEGAANKLGKKFVVYGYKTNSNDTKSDVYDHYNVNWAGTANHTESNTNGWEYVGYDPNALSGLSGVNQTIKYWDYSAKQYDFIAFSFGEATQTTEETVAEGSVKATAVSITTTSDPVTYIEPSYTLTGNVKDLANVYIADRVTAKKIVSEPIANRLVPYGTAIPFNFRSLGTKVRIGLYEIIPGYSVKDVKFYKNDTEKNDTETTPCLYASLATIPSGKGTMTVTFGTSGTDLNKAHVAWGSNDPKVSVLTVGNFPTGNKEKNEDEETSGNVQYLVRNSTDARGANSMVNPYTTVLPAPVGNLNLKVDYTLVSIDGSKETINVTGATAVVPKVYTNWEPNYAYTYIFKISDNTNGSTGGGVTGLYPITFDAIVTETEDGLSETITTVSEPSITTYSLGAVGDEYTAGKSVYVSVVKGNAEQTLTVGNNCALYTATVEGQAVQDITEATVANCLAHGTQGPTGTYTATDANGRKLVVTKVDGLTTTTTIDATDAPDGNAIRAISGNFAKFTPSAGTYVFQYIEGDNKYYKVIKVTRSI